jgi:hypothetical protein
MTAALRLLRILISVVICIVFLVCVGAVLLSLVVSSNEPMNPLRNAGWALAFHAPGALFIFTIPLTAIAFAMDRFGLRRWYFHVVLWLGAGMIGHFAMSLVAGPLTGLLYWALAGRMAGRPGVDLARLPTVPRRLLDFAGFAAVGYFVFVVAGLVWFGGKMLWVTVVPPHPGVPPFATRYEHQMTTRVKVAMLDYPDPESCLEEGARPEMTEDLKRLDWDRIKTPAEATVCIFRLLGSYGDISRSEAWLMAQGFRLSGPGFNAEKPYVDRDGTKRVDAGWHIREKGPLFPTRGMLRRALYSIPYGMSVYTTWRADGQTLLYVHLSFSTL